MQAQQHQHHSTRTVDAMDDTTSRGNSSGLFNDNKNTNTNDHTNLSGLAASCRAVAAPSPSSMPSSALVPLSSPAEATNILPLSRGYLLPCEEEMALKHKLQRGAERITVDAILERYRKNRIVRAHREECIREMKMENLKAFGLDEDDFPFYQPLCTFADLPRSVRQKVFEFLPAISVPFEMDLQYLLSVLQVNDGSIIRNPKHARAVVQQVEDELSRHRRMFGLFAVYAWALGIPTITRSTVLGGGGVTQSSVNAQIGLDESPYGFFAADGGSGADGHHTSKNGASKPTMKFLSPRLVLKELALKQQLDEEAKQLLFAHYRREQQIDLFKEGVFYLNPANRANTTATTPGANNGTSTPSGLRKSGSALESPFSMDRVTSFRSMASSSSGTTGNMTMHTRMLVEEGPPSALVALATAAAELKQLRREQEQQMYAEVEEIERERDEAEDAADFSNSRGCSEEANLVLPLSSRSDHANKDGGDISPLVHMEPIRGGSAGATAAACRQEQQPCHSRESESTADEDDDTEHGEAVYSPTPQQALDATGTFTALNLMIKAEGEGDRRNSSEENSNPLNADRVHVSPRPSRSVAVVFNPTDEGGDDHAASSSSALVTRGTILNAAAVGSGVSAVRKKADGIATPAVSGVSGGTSAAGLRPVSAMATAESDSIKQHQEILVGGAVGMLATHPSSASVTSTTSTRLTTTTTTNRGAGGTFSTVSPRDHSAVASANNTTLASNTTNNNTSAAAALVATKKTSVVLHDPRLMRSALARHPQRRHIRATIHLAVQLIAHLRDRINKYEKWTLFREKVFATPCGELRPYLRKAIGEWEDQLLAWERERNVVVGMLSKEKEKKAANSRSAAGQQKRQASTTAIGAIVADNRDVAVHGDDKLLTTHASKKESRENTATEGNSMSAKLSTTVVQTDSKCVVSEIAHQELLYIKQRVGSVEFIGNPITEMDTVKAMFRECNIKIPEEVLKKGLITEDTYAKTLTFSQCASLGLLDIPWVMGYCWQDKVGILLTRQRELRVAKEKKLRELEQKLLAKEKDLARKQKHPQHLRLLAAKKRREDLDDPTATHSHYRVDDDDDVDLTEKALLALKSDAEDEDSDGKAANAAEETPDQQRDRGEVVPYNKTRIGRLHPARGDPLAKQLSPDETAAGEGVSPFGQTDAFSSSVVEQGNGTTNHSAAQHREMSALHKCRDSRRSGVNTDDSNGEDDDDDTEDPLILTTRRSTIAGAPASCAPTNKATAATAATAAAPTYSALERVSMLMGLRPKAPHPSSAGQNTSLVKNTPVVTVPTSLGSAVFQSNAAAPHDRQSMTTINRSSIFNTTANSSSAGGAAGATANSFTYSVGLNDTSVEAVSALEAKAARKEAAAKRRRLWKARDVAATAMAQRIWRPHLVFKPRQFHAFGGCELCSDPNIKMLGMAKKASGSSGGGDVVLCDQCYYECYHYDEAAEGISEEAKKAAAVGEQQESSSKSDNKYIYRMYDWYVIRDLIGLGREGDLEDDDENSAGEDARREDVDDKGDRKKIEEGRTQGIATADQQTTRL